MWANLFVPLTLSLNLSQALYVGPFLIMAQHAKCICSNRNSTDNSEGKERTNVDGNTDEVADQIAHLKLLESLKIRSLIIKQQVVVGLIILLLVFYTFYRLLHVWLHTLNFSEVVAQSLITSSKDLIQCCRYPPLFVEHTLNFSKAVKKYVTFSTKHIL